MKIVISPAKSLDFEREYPEFKLTQPHFLEKAVQLNKVLAKKKPKALMELMNISDNLAQLNWQRNRDFETPFTLNNARPAIYAFDGDVYKGLDAYTLSSQKIERLQDTLRILSGLYGVLRPLDLMQPYRLEMGTKLKVGRKRDLYGFWKKSITDHLNSEVKEDELFVNLASKEYFGAVDEDALKAPVITPVFKDWGSDTLKIISFYAKKARGSMVRYIVENDVKTFEDLKGFDYDDYSYSESHTSKKNEPVFIR
ncbi:MAG TPA: peroxide stress protein YaaA [Pricia sp.]|nr:peroxide stress protein YaaA [Pricia sp.]